MTFENNSLESYISYALAAANRKLHTDLSRDLKEMGVQVEVWRVLQTLRASRDKTMSELAQIVLMNPPTLTKLVDRMVSDGLVQRHLAPEDNRRVQLSLTDFGDKLCTQIMEHVDAQNDKIMTALGPERASLLREALASLA